MMFVARTVPILESGDRRSREAFERLYAQCPHIKQRN